ncbi:MAG: hypothetical protein LC539_19670 [Candidatus Thiodiazotropha sp.]|nr:hypothetical protein [Candidatus Thiodiazotropha sp.]
MTIRDSNTSRVYQEFGAGQFWDLIAEDFEKKHPDKKVFRLEGLGSIIARELILDSPVKQKIIDDAIRLFVLDEWKRHRQKPEKLQRIEAAIYMLEEMTTTDTKQEATNAIYISG